MGFSDPNLPYLVPRLARHLLPEGFVRALLLRNVIIRPGLETSDPFAAVQRYVAVLSARGLSFRGKRVLVFGYGGRFDMGFGLLEQGAAHVVLCDKFAPPDEAHNRQRFAMEAKYFLATEKGLRPRPEWMTLVEADIREAGTTAGMEPVDIILSSSVYEHLDDVEGVTEALARVTKAGGIHIHYVDLRDHFFKYPFEMLRFSEPTWRRWLNPSSNHNRYRVWDYRRVFESCFGPVEIEVLGRDEEAFLRLKARIRPEFMSGRLDEDAVTLIRVIAFRPLS
jgi:hypothetical protein